MKRRRFLEVAAAGMAGLAHTDEALGSSETPAANFNLEPGGRDFSPATRKERKKIPSACWQCVSRCGIVGYLENGRLVKIEGNPEMIRTRGKLCPRGQAGINQVYNPDRLLHPLKRKGKRGEGLWERISWSEALDLLVEGGEIGGREVKGLRELREAGSPEKFMFHYGRTVGSDAKILFEYFLPAYGTGTIGDHASICINAGGIARMLTPGPAVGSQLDEAAIILNFGCSLLDAGLDHLVRAQAFNTALSGGARIYTFDVRLSNTAARSTEWIPVKPATDLAVVLAMCHALVASGEHDEEFIRDHTNVSTDEIREHLAGYTPEWAEKTSGVPAAKIRSIALEFARTRPRVVTSLRGAFMHHNGVQTARALIMLRVLAGGVDWEREFGPRPRWEYPFPRPEDNSKGLDLFEGGEGAYAFPQGHVSHQILRRIDEGPERPDLYMVYCHNPVYANGDCLENARVYKDEAKIPFLVAVDVTMSETSELADLVLPDATYLERWTLEGRSSPEKIPEYYIQQPMHPPLGEARNFLDVACEIAARLDLDLGFSSAEEFVRASCDSTPGVKEAGGFEYMNRHGIWHDQDAEPFQFPGGTIEIKSTALEEKGFPAIPDWMPVPEHQEMTEEDLILTTFKVSVQTHSRTQGCKWLTELYHDNPAWINPRAAAARGIKTGDRIRVVSDVGEIVTRARVTEGVHPQAVAISHSAGHWAWGEYASGTRGPEHRAEPDSKYRWWTENGAHPNLIIPNRGDPIAGSMCWNDTLVRVEKV
jgi:anaerobic selenocysteine-containing dehydrogenase